MLIALEGIAICFIVLLVCVIAIADEPIHKAIVSGRYTSGIKFKEKIVME